MAKLLFLLATLYTVVTVGELAAILRGQVLQEHFVSVKPEDEGDAGPGDPLFLTPYIKKGDYQTGKL